MVPLAVLLVTVSSSPLSDAQDDAELKEVSMGTFNSESADMLCGDDGAEEVDDAEEEGEEDKEVEGEGLEVVLGMGMGSVGQGTVCVPCSMWCSWLLFIMLFMAFCISKSMRCFSRLGMRPNRTAEEDRVHKNQPLCSWTNYSFSTLSIIEEF